ncbi:MAG: fasciclin domain-containing protein [Betaproteobacteria bacterium]
MTSFSKLIAAGVLAIASSVAAAADIVDTAIAAGNFKTLVKAVQEAGLVDTLKGQGPFTVFAPTDAAFAKLPAGTLDGLLKDKEKLAQLLTYHVVPGKVTAADIKPGDVKTVEGQSLKLRTKGSAVMVNNAKVTNADIMASNGVIHVIDTVMIPN